MKIIKIFRILPVLLVLVSCTDLEEKLLDEELSTETPSSENALAAAYNNIISDVFVDHAHLWGLQEYSTDEALLPTRGSDWGDGGKYRTIQEFTWGSDASLVDGNWSSLTSGITNSLTAIETINENSDDSNASMYLAEAKGLLYMYTYYNLDLFGQCPMKEAVSTDENVWAVYSTYIDTLITNVEGIVDDLSALGENSTYDGRFTKEAAYALLADMYMNRAVFKDRYNENSDFSFTEASVDDANSTDMDKVIEYTTKLIDSGEFSLEENYFDNFSIGNEEGTEMIFVAPQNVEDGIVTGQNDFAYMPCARAQKPGEGGMRGTNATCTTPEYYATWDDNQDDPRFMQKYQYEDGTWFYNNQEQNIPVSIMDYVEDGDDALWFHFNRGFLEGQQYGPTIDDDNLYNRVTVDGEECVAVTALETDKNDSMLVFTPELNFSSGSILPQTEVHQGVRIFKFEFDPIGGSNSSSQVDIPIFRLGYIYTLRAEAYFRSGNPSDALDDINVLRTSRVRTQPDEEGGTITGQAISSLDETTLYNEISYENYWEGKRRPQMIRFGTFDDAYTAKEESEPYRRLYPIPQDVIDVSGDIFSQNTGY